jgi:hypothetical protein
MCRDKRINNDLTMGKRGRQGFLPLKYMRNSEHLQIGALGIEKISHIQPQNTPHSF